MIGNEIRFVEDACLFGPSDLGTIEVTLFPKDDLVLPASFRGVRRQTCSVLTGDLATPLRLTMAEEPAVEAQWLYVDADDTFGNLTTYLQSNDRLYCEREASHFMRETLIMAYEMLDENNDGLLRDAVSLWASTSILTDPHRVWYITSLPRTAEKPDETAQETIPPMQITPESDPLSYRLITGQLNELIEKRADSLCKSVMHDFEKRLIQRQKSQQQQFETFLTALILMNCLEKLSWLFNTWAVKEQEVQNHEQYHKQDQSGDSPEATTPIATSRGAWPTKRSPSEYVERGETIAYIIAMLVKMRELPPPMAVDEEKYLVADLTKKPPKGARYDASGYKGPPISRKGKINKKLTDLDTLFGITDPEGRRNGEMHLSDDIGASGHLSLDLLNQEPVDEHQASLIAQLHKDLQANGLSYNFGTPNPSSVDPPVDPSISAGETPGDAVVDTASATDARSRDDDSHLEATKNADEAKDLSLAALEAIISRQASPPEAREDNSAEQQNPEAPAIDVIKSAGLTAFSEDPLFAHLRQAAEAAAQETQEDDYDENSEMQQADMRGLNDQPPRTPPVDIWFSRIKLKVEDVIRARTRPSWDDKDPRCWELKYISRMLLPADMPTGRDTLPDGGE